MSRSDSIPRHARRSFYTYLHRRLDSGLVFYAGKGTRTRGASTNGRSEHWRRVVDKCGYSIEVAGVWESEDEAFSHERLLISVFRDLGHPLINKTDGGDGASGCIHSAETIAKRSASLRALRSSDPEFDARRIAALREAKKTEAARLTHSEAMKRHRSTEAARRKQSLDSRAAWSDKTSREARIASIKNGRAQLGSERIAAASRMKFQDAAIKEKVVGNLLKANTKRRRQVMCVSTGQVFESIASAAKSLGVTRACIIGACNGRQKTTAGVVVRYCDT